MANEWIPIELYGSNNDGGKRRVTIADGVSVSKGSVLQLLDPRTASGAHKYAVPIAGVAAEEHIANQGVTEISVWTDGIFDVKVSGASSIGDPFVLAWQDDTYNQVQAASGAGTIASSQAILLNVGARIGGYIMEDATNAEVVNVRLRL